MAKATEISDPAPWFVATTRGSKLRAFLPAVFLGLISSPSSPATGAEIVTIQLENYDNLNNLSIDVDDGLGFNLASDGEIWCNYLLRGVIEEGDLDRLKAVIKPLEERNDIPRLCLHSPGGSYDEGIKITRYLISENIGTAVPKEAECYSACAFIFMGGTYPWKGQLNRFLHVLGNLGFHAPYIPGRTDDAAPVSSADLAAYYAAAVKDMRLLMEVGVGNEVKRFPPELMEELIGKKPEEFFLLDTVGKAIRYRVHLYGAKLSAPLDNRTFCNACINTKYFAREEYGAGAESDLCASPGEIEEKKFPEGRRLVYQVAPRAGTCQIDLSENGGKVTGWTYINRADGLWEEDADQKEAAWNDGLELAYWYLYPPNMPIYALSSGEPDTSMSGADTASVTPADVKPGVGGSTAMRPDVGSDAARAVEKFVRDEFLGHGKVNHASRDAIFAADVDYYGKPMSRAEVATDRQNYDRKWPNRKYQVIEGSMVISANPDGKYDVAFNYAFTVSNNAKTTSGIATVNLTVQAHENSFEIIREAGEVTSKASR